MTTPGLPEVSLFLHVDCVGVDLSWLESRVAEALPLCAESVGTEQPLLRELSEVEVSLVTDEAIAAVHGQFMDDPTATDVITFHHGEILVSVDTAQREGPEHGHSTSSEVLLYIIHGLLHLNGHIDSEEQERTAMHRAQEVILSEVTQ